MGRAGREHEIVRLIGLEHLPHAEHIVPRETPVALGVQIAHVDLVLQPHLDPGGGPNQNNGPVLHNGQETILLTAIEAVDFVDQEKRALPHPAARARGLEGLFQFGDAAEHCRELFEMQLEDGGEKPRDGRLARPRFIDFKGGDIYDLPADFAKGAKLAFGFPPCTDLASSGARWWNGKEKKNPGTLARAVALAKHCFDLISKADAYAMENPIGRLSTHWRKPDEKFDPYQYGGYLSPIGEQYTKKTCLWTGGNWTTPPMREVDPVEGSKMHRMPGGGRTKSRNDRSVTPMGWSLATFQHLSGTF